LITSVDVGAPINKLCLHKDSSLLAVVSDDLIIRIYDIETKTLVRRFEGHSGQLITDVVCLLIYSFFEVSPKSLTVVEFLLLVI
jgi:WD40 repeat protein